MATDVTWEEFAVINTGTGYPLQLPAKPLASNKVSVTTSTQLSPALLNARLIAVSCWGPDALCIAVGPSITEATDQDPPIFPGCIRFFSCAPSDKLYGVSVAMP